VNEGRRVARVGLARATSSAGNTSKSSDRWAACVSGLDAEVLGRAHREAQLRVKVRLGRNGERVRFTRVRASVGVSSAAISSPTPGASGSGTKSRMS
jgi:hypothetical protein